MSGPDQEKPVPPGPERGERTRRLPREDRVAFGLILLLVCLIGLGAAYMTGQLLELVGLVMGAYVQGIGLRSAFLAALPASIVMMVLFAVVAGDGLVGELGLMLVGFFVMLIFFTGTIALVL